MFIVLTFIVGVVTLLYFYLTSNNDYWLKRNIPGPKPLPLFGNMKDVLIKNKEMKYVLDMIYR